MNNKKLITVGILILLVTIFVTSKYQKYRDEQEYERKITSAYLYTMSRSLHEMADTLQNVSDGENNVYYYEQFLIKLNTTIEICGIYTGLDDAYHNYIDDIYLTLDDLEFVLNNGYASNTLYYHEGKSFHISFQSLLFDDQITDNEKEFLYIIQNDFMTIAKKLWEFTNPSEEEIITIFEPLAKYRYLYEEWTINVKN